MTFPVFELERWQSDWEHTVEYNLADSSVRGASLADFVSEAEWAALRDLTLGYPQVNGTDALRHLIAGLYRNAAPANVLVTVGGAEANQIACQTLIEPGDRVFVTEPGYRQVHGLATLAGATVSALPLTAERGWRADLDRLERELDERTKLIYVVNPNNPTGTILTREERSRIVHLAAKRGAWVLADEVYAGSERDDRPVTPSFWDEYERVVVVNSLSKAYGLPGLRIGWLVAPASLVGPLWRRHEYAVIAAAAPSMKLAEVALAEPVRSKLLARQRRLSAEGWALLDQWLRAHPELATVEPSEATSIAFVRYRLPLDSVAVATAIREQASVLVAPGAYLGAEGYLRITLGVGPDTVGPALERIARVLGSLR